MFFFLFSFPFYFLFQKQQNARSDLSKEGARQSAVLPDLLPQQSSGGGSSSKDANRDDASLLMNQVRTHSIRSYLTFCVLFFIAMPSIPIQTDKMSAF